MLDNLSGFGRECPLGHIDHYDRIWTPPRLASTPFCGGGVPGERQPEPRRQVNPNLHTDPTGTPLRPHLPLSHPFVECLIGTIRRELLDKMLFRNAHDLHRKLDRFRQYYNAHRVRNALDGDTPSEFPSDIIIHDAELHQFS